MSIRTLVAILVLFFGARLGAAAPPDGMGIEEAEAREVLLLDREPGTQFLRHRFLELRGLVDASAAVRRDHLAEYFRLDSRTVDLAEVTKEYRNHLRAGAIAGFRAELPSPVVVPLTERGRVAAPEFDGATLKVFGRSLGSRALELHADEIATLNREILARGLTGRPSGPEGRKLVSRLDRIVALLAADVAGKQRVFEMTRDPAVPDRAMSPRSAMPRSPFPRSLGTATVHSRLLESDNLLVLGCEALRLALKANAVDEANRYGLEVMKANALARIAGAMRVLVAVHRMSDGDAGPVFMGSGFLYRGCVVTAAHLFAKERFWTDDGPDLSEVRVAFVSETGDFVWDDPVPVATDRSRIWPEWDVACLVLDVADDDAGPETPAVRFASDVEDLAGGTLYGFCALDFGEELPAPAWIPPGPIVFPERTVFPAEGLSDSALALFGRILRTELFGGSQEFWTPESLQEAFQRVVDAYDLTGPLGFHYLRREVDPMNFLPRISDDEDFRRSRKVRCVGSDLVTRGGASGAPIFLLDPNGDPKVVGIHAGVVGDPSDSLAPPSLDSFTRTISFPRVKPILDEHIDSLP